MRIALITDGIWPYVLGGMQKHSYFLCRYLARNKVHVELFHFNQSTYDPDKLEFFTEQEKEFIHPHIVEMPFTRRFPGQYIYRSWLHSKRIYELLLPSLDQYDFIYTKGFTGWYLINRKFNKKVTCAPIGVNFHGYEMFQKAPDLKSLIQQYLLLRQPVKKLTRQADIVFSYGGKITGIISDLGVPLDKIVEMPAGVEENSWVPDVKKASSPVKFVFLGRYERRKGVEELNKAIGILALEFPLRFEFHFIGPIPDDKKLMLKEVFYHGEIRDKTLLTERLRSCDVLLCPSWSEGMPNVILEAMANGLAVIATDVGASGLLVTGNTGWLLQNANPQMIADAMKEALNPVGNKLKSKKEAALLQVKAYTWEKNINKFLDFLLSSKD